MIKTGYEGKQNLAAHSLLTFSAYSHMWRDIVSVAGLLSIPLGQCVLSQLLLQGVVDAAMVENVKLDGGKHLWKEFKCLQLNVMQPIQPNCNDGI